jgi:hypothetical protein
MQKRVPWSLLWAFEAGLPFERSEAAAFVKTFLIQDTTLVFFGLSEIVITEIEEDGERCSLVERRMAAPAFTISGANPMTNEVRRLRTDLAAYWKGWEGIEVKPGPGRPRKLTADDVEAATKDFVNTHSRQPTTEELWAHLTDPINPCYVDVSRSTVYRTAKPPSR